MREAGEQEQEARHHTQDECHHLVAGERRHARADREEAAGEQQAAEVRGQDRAVVGLTQIIDREPQREGEGEGEGGEEPGGQELAEHRLPQRHAAAS